MYKKIYIIGPSGSGKSTLARNLSIKYNISNYELDKVVWDDEHGNIRRNEEDIKVFFKDIIKQDSWIIEDVGRRVFIDGVRNSDIVYYIDLSSFAIYRRCINRWIKQKLGKEKYNYKPTIKGLFEMLGWATEDLKNKNNKIKYIKDNSRSYKILKKNDLKSIFTK